MRVAVFRDHITARHHQEKQMGLTLSPIFPNLENGPIQLICRLTAGGSTEQRFCNARNASSALFFFFTFLAPCLRSILVRVEFWHFTSRVSSGLYGVVQISFPRKKFGAQIREIRHQTSAKSTSRFPRFFFFFLCVCSPPPTPLYLHLFTSADDTSQWSWLKGGVSSEPEVRRPVDSRQSSLYAGDFQWRSRRAGVPVPSSQTNRRSYSIG